MKNRLLWKLLATIAVGTVLLFWAINWLTEQTQSRMSYLDKTYQKQLLDYGKQAETIYLNQGEAALAQWLLDLQAKEDTWAAVVTSSIVPIANSTILEEFEQDFQLGRSVEWKIHLYFNYNPVMEVPFLDASHHLLIRLPQRMRPGSWLPQTEILLQIALPLLLLCALSYVLYQHVMSPLRKLENATHEFSMGKFNVRVYDAVQHREDELARLALTFDKMAHRISKMIYNQRQMLSDLSHELRTPLTRIDMAIDCLEQQPSSHRALERLRYETCTMRELAEDTLTLAWLNTESPALKSENYDLVELLQVIADDARFEFPEQKLQLQLPQQALISQSNQQALGQAFENILRNAMRHTPKAGRVIVNLSATEQHYTLLICDQGPGVPDTLLDDIFKPFFRVDSARTCNNTSTQLSTDGCAGYSAPVQSGKRGGFGLGLALAQRQIQAVGGSITANNEINNQGGIAGLQIQITLPKD